MTFELATYASLFLWSAVLYGVIVPLAVALVQSLKQGATGSGFANPGRVYLSAAALLFLVDQASGAHLGVEGSVVALRLLDDLSNGEVVRWLMSLPRG